MGFKDSMESYAEENDLYNKVGDDKSARWDSIGDVSKMANIIVGKGGSKKPQGEQKPDPIEHSPEMKQAVERVRTYENDVMSGKMSEDIFGSINTDDSGPAAAFDSSKGMAGIGTNVGVNADNGAYKATNSFLDNKKSEIKKEFNFKPVPTRYGS